MYPIRFQIQIRLVAIFDNMNLLDLRYYQIHLPNRPRNHHLNHHLNQIGHFKYKLFAIDLILKIRRHHLTLAKILNLHL